MVDGRGGGRRDLVERGADARLDRGEDRPLDERCLADADPGPVVGSSSSSASSRLSAALPRSNSTSTPSAPASSVDRSAAAIRGALVPSRPSSVPPAVADGHLVTGDLGDHVAQPVDERPAVGDQDQAHQSRLLSMPAIAGVRRCSDRDRQEASKTHQQVR